jgi:hypothetical protein
MNVKLSGVCVSVALFGLACSGGEAPSADKKAAPPSAAKSAAPATQAAPEPPKKAWVKVDAFGVQLEVPAGAKFEPGAGTSLMLMTQDGGCTVMLSKKDDMSFFQSYDSTIGDIEKGTMGKKKDMIKNEKVDDANWTIYYTKEGMIDPGKLQYAVDVRKKVGEGEYSCGRVSDNEADAKCVLEACASLKPLDGAAPAAGSAAAPGSAAGSAAAPGSAAGSAP